MRNPRLAVTLIAAVLGCLVAGCGSDGGNGPSSDGPMGPVMDSGYSCAPVQAPGDSMSLGGLYVQNQGHQVITISRISLTGHGLVLTGAWLIPNVRNSGLGATTPYPPGPDNGISMKLWATGRSPDGFRLKPRHVATFVFGLAPTSSKGGIAYPVIHYNSGGTQYVYDSAYGGEVLVGANADCP